MDQPEDIAVPDLAGDHLLEDVVNDGWKELFEVALQHVAMSPGEVLEAIDGGVSSLALGRVNPF